MPLESPLLARSQWRTHTISATTTLWVMGDASCDAQLCRLMDDVESLAEGLRTVAGHFAAVIVGPEGIILIEDPIRSFPIFYTVTGTVARVSDGVSALAGASADYVADYDSRIEFRHGAYVAGSNTLHAGVHQVQAGELVTISATGDISQEFYRQIHYSALRLEETAAVDAHFTAALDASMSRLLAHAKGRQLVVPLSGGLDSRLLSVYLKDAGYTNVVNFTYGTGKTREVLISEQVAAALDQKWLFCPYDEATIRDAWDIPETADFIEFTHAGASLPHIQDWYAVRWLKEEGLIDDDAIFLPGHTIVGNMHDDAILEAESTSRDDIKELILKHHYTLQPDNGAAHRNVRLKRTIDAFLDQIGYDGSAVSRLTALEYWNVLERQTKYINNSVRNYEFFGYEWALPMLDREVYLAWGDLHPNITRNRDWYEGYVNRRYFAATGQDLGTFAPTDVPKSSRDAVKRILGSVGLLRVVESFITARAVQNHPMGFNWFVRGMSPAELFAFTRSGGNLLGAYADEFLTDTWNSHCRLFTPEDTFH
ncbi:adenine nucleotide alpha hydrolase family protein [Arthrobacter sp. HLT1-20]